MVVVQINYKKRRGYRLVKEYGIITVIRPNVTYRMRCSMCKLYGKESDPSVFANWVETDSGVVCPQCAGKMEVI